MKPTLFLLAAGMGSRYGGLKQLDGLGPNGETIMDYSIYDAIQAGFGKLVFVIRKDFEQEFREKIISKYEGHIPCETRKLSANTKATFLAKWYSRDWMPSQKDSLVRKAA